MHDARLVLRPAARDDLPQLRLLHAHAMRLLGRSHYDLATIEAYLSHVGTIDPSFIQDGTAIAAERNGVILGSIGWSTRVRADDTPGEGVQPRAPAVSVLFVDPDHARRGIGRRLLADAERRIRAGGDQRLTILASLNAVPFCRAAGFTDAAPAAIDLPCGRRFARIAMHKRLDPAALRTAA